MCLTKRQKGSLEPAGCYKRRQLEWRIYEIYDTSSSSVPRSITPVLFTAGWTRGREGGRGGGLHTPCEGSDKHLLTERNANKLLRRRTAQGGGIRMGGGHGVKKGKGQKENTPSPVASCKLPTQEIDPESSRTMHLLLQRRSSDVLTLWATDGCRVSDRDVLSSPWKSESRSYFVALPKMYYLVWSTEEHLKTLIHVCLFLSSFLFIPRHPIIPNTNKVEDYRRGGRDCWWGQMTTDLAD